MNRLNVTTKISTLPVIAISLLVGGLFILAPLGAQLNADVVYIIKDRQKEKQSTRWTLTEWLRIKERMRLMDVWLAMFSTPQKDQFKPELHLRYAFLNLAHTWTNKDIDFSIPKTTYQNANAKLYLTNLVSASTGLRTLNIDFGFTGEIEKYADKSEGFGGTFRFFGKNNQDTSIEAGVLYVKREKRVPSDFNTVFDRAGEKATFEQLLVRGELQVYFLNFLGVTGFYDHYPTIAKSLSGPPLNIKSRSYGGEVFLEVSLLRLSFGYLQDDYILTNETLRFDEIGKGTYGALALYF